MNKFIIAKQLLAIAESIVAYEERRNAIENIDNHVAYHGSMNGNITALEGRVAGAYRDLGPVVFLTPFFGTACGFAFNADAMDDYLVKHGVKSWYNFDHSMIKDLKKRKEKYKSVDIDLYVDTDSKLDNGDIIEQKIYVYEIDISKYIEEGKVKTINNNDFEFIINGVDEIPVDKKHEVIVKYHVYNDIITEIRRKFYKKIKRCRYFQNMVKINDYEYRLVESGHEYGQIILEPDKNKNMIKLWLQYPFEENNWQSFDFRGIEKTISWMIKNSKKIYDYIRGYSKRKY